MVSMCCRSVVQLMCSPDKLIQKGPLCRCPLGSSLKGNSQTGHWGYWYDLLEPAMVVANDSVVDIEMPTFEASSACEQSLKCYTCCALPACALLPAALQTSVHHQVLLLEPEQLSQFGYSRQVLPCCTAAPTNRHPAPSD